MYYHLNERTQSRVLPISTTHTVTLNPTEKSGHVQYVAQLWSEEGKCYELKILPIYRLGTDSLMSVSGSARIEICEMRKDDWMLYRLVYTNIVECRRDLAQGVANEIRDALEQIQVIGQLEPLEINFRENGIKRSITAF
ncbi:hypothetical protein G6Z92_18605 [Vibrio aestuarianus subsp. cardii]|uniref:hypothetical protein n=1 Tax=Vibrio aestuarianus TaxID=28171 RepID=UPI0015C575ED|nr:hypothetical protein [Vibrio aestuarianus]NGZ68928.1 hypothetical protein [Vibrio aestuarianus subsp. cardii]